VIRTDGLEWDQPRVAYTLRPVGVDAAPDIRSVSIMIASTSSWPSQGIDLRRCNIAVTDCGSRDNLPDYVWFCAELGLKYLAVMDADSATPSALTNAQAVRDADDLRQGGELAEFPVSLEATFGVSKPKRGPSLVPGAMGCCPSSATCQTRRRCPPRSSRWRRRSGAS
jgi:hypothetical protein